MAGVALTASPDIVAHFVDGTVGFDKHNQEFDESKNDESNKAEANQLPDPQKGTRGEQIHMSNLSDRPR